MILVVKFQSIFKKHLNHKLALSKSLALVLLATILSSCQNSSLHEFEGMIMGTNYKILIAGEIPSSINHGLLFNILDSVNQEMSTYLPESPLNKLNKLPTSLWFTASKELLEVISYAQDVCIISDGAFDISIGNIVNKWGFGPPLSFATKTESIDTLIKDVGCESIEINKPRNQIRRLKEVSLDLSAIAKGYAIDKLSEYLLDLNIYNFLIELGGEIRVNGDKRGSQWEVGIENPLNQKEPLLILDMSNFQNYALATSGIYRNFKIVENNFISHTFDPRTGRSVDSQLLSVSVIDNLAIKADTLATTLNVLGMKKGMEFAEEHKIKALFVMNKNNKAYYKTSSEYDKLLK